MTQRGEGKEVFSQAGTLHVGSWVISTGETTIVANRIATIRSTNKTKRLENRCACSVGPVDGA